MVSKLIWLSLLMMSNSLLASQDIQNLDEIITAAHTFLLKLYGENKYPPPVITIDPLDQRLRLAKCENNLELSLAPGARSTGRTVVMVRCNSARPWSIYIPAKLSVPVFVVVAARPIIKEQVITTADITVEARESSDLPAGYLTDPNQILGKILSRPVTAGAILVPGQIRNSLVIHRGDRVTLIVNNGGLTVKSTGIALSNAGVGERVSVRNESSKRIVEGSAAKAGVVIMD